MNWRESLLTAILQGTSAKDAKVPSASNDSHLLHLLHTFDARSNQKSGPADESARIVNAEILDSNQSEPLENVLKGLAIELWSDAAGALFIVADEEDARLIGERRGMVYTGAELRRVVQIEDPATVLEIHKWKRTFDGRIREVETRPSRRRGGDLGTGEPK